MHALLLIDLQNDFLPGGALAVPEGDAVVPIANALMKEYPLVVATQDWHPSDHLSFASQHQDKVPYDQIELAGLPQTLWPDHCVQGSQGAEFAPGLRVDNIDHVVPKGTDREIDSYSGFFDNGGLKSTGLTEFLHERGVTELTLVGLATDYCVKFTALDAITEGFRTHLLPAGCRGVGLAKEDVREALRAMRKAGVRIAPANQVTKPKPKTKST